jgi:regulator of sirC expression with transglutaminase-like and TPR domain
MLSREALRAANRSRFARLVARPEAEIDLAAGALCIAADITPDLDPDPTLEIIEGLAERVRLRLDLGDSADYILDRIHDVLYREARFRAPTAAEYHDPENSLLDEVATRRVGLPISLAIVELEVGWRVGLRLHGVGLPGHFIVGTPSGTFIDPAGGGRSLTRDDCQALIRRALGEGVLLHAGMLRPASKRTILARVLRNLRSAYLARREWASALGAVEMLEVIEPTDPDHGRDRGLLLGRMGRFSDAIACLGRYLDERPDGHDAGEVRQVAAIFAGRRN